MYSTQWWLAALVVALTSTVASSQNVYHGTGGQIWDNGFGCGDDSVAWQPFGEIQIAGEAGTEIESVELTGLNHGWVGALEIVLEGPGDYSTHLIDRPGTSGTACGSSSDFVSDNTYEWSNDGELFTEFFPPVIPSGDYFPTGDLGLPSNPLPTGDLNGTWQIMIRDMNGGDTGSFDSWSITVVPEPSTCALVALGGLALLRRRARP